MAGRERCASLTTPDLPDALEFRGPVELDNFTGTRAMEMLLKDGVHQYPRSHRHGREKKYPDEPIGRKTTPSYGKQGEHQTSNRQNQGRQGRPVIHRLNDKMSIERPADDGVKERPGHRDFPFRKQSEENERDQTGSEPDVDDFHLVNFHEQLPGSGCQRTADNA